MNLIFNEFEINIIEKDQDETFEKWGSVNYYQYDDYDGFMTWATYGWV